ncbi:hypothetical protein LY28_02404 [Ruminiclostridium sufflavum DSM 19573]|uniref:Uncharacterized protein n=1 Tax=Ruminiclostridium sufflavum DSM 19573 TaxID=1121337 RepID=A0A318XJ33_9FIRM|nr:DUF6514 family protein [Ruminiclostridium sufflavum]PYG87024.1 hypothetical protein LY28_02404 [Ruminiclostridium sufflavum DSM 19573]
MELVCSKKLELDETLECKSREINLEYYLLACTVDDYCRYGMQINMTRNSGESETAIIRDVFTSREEMINLIKLFHSNSVTPVSALDIVYDFID